MCCRGEILVFQQMRVNTTTASNPIYNTTQNNTQGAASHARGRTHLCVGHAGEDLAAVHAGDGAAAPADVVLHLRLLERLIAALAREEDHGCWL